MKMAVNLHFPVYAPRFVYPLPIIRSIYEFSASIFASDGVFCATLGGAFGDCTAARDAEAPDAAFRMHFPSSVPTEYRL